LALNYPIKKWAAALAIFAAILYDLGTGSRVGAERALVMTLVMLVAVLFDRPALSMRNLAWAAFFVLAFEPEALLGASFQLSFAAVAALIAVFEARGESRAAMRDAPAIARADGSPLRVFGAASRPDRGRPCSPPSARLQPLPPSWPMTSMNSAPMC
jgi:competence protein ComEC